MPKQGPPTRKPGRCGSWVLILLLTLAVLLQVPAASAEGCRGDAGCWTFRGLFARINTDNSLFPDPDSQIERPNYIVSSGRSLSPEGAGFLFWVRIFRVP